MFSNAVTKPIKIVLIEVTKPIKIVLIEVTKPTKIVLIKGTEIVPFIVWSFIMQWINVNEKYLDYLRTYEKRIPITDYGTDRYKPFFGILFETNGLYFITQISHAQARHKNMKKQPDFFKIYDPQELSRLIAVVNLNYMFPISKNDVTPFTKSQIDTYRTFKSVDEKSKYIDLLDSEMKMINTMNLSEAAKKLYISKYKFPESKVSQRCLDYKMLEELALKWASDRQ